MVPCLKQEHSCVGLPFGALCHCWGRGDLKPIPAPGGLCSSARHHRVLLYPCILFAVSLLWQTKQVSVWRF